MLIIMRRWQVLLGFFVLGFGVYAWFLNNPFVMDDEIQVIGSPYIQTIDIPEFFTSSTIGAGGATKMGGIYYKPIMTTYYALAYHFGGLDPATFRWPALILHILSAFFLFQLLSRHLSERSSLLMGLIFLLHPVNAEVVLYIADVQDILYMFFGLLALLALVRYTGWRLFGMMVLLFTCGLLCKETGALFMAIATVYAWLFERKKTSTVIGAGAVVTVAYLWVRHAVGLTTLSSPELLFHRATWLERMTTLPRVVWHYIEIFLFPDRLSLTTDFVQRDLTLDGFWLPLAGVLLFVFFLFRLYSRLPKGKYKALYTFFVAVLSLWFILHTHVLVPLDGVYADRWFYLGVWSLAGMLLVAVESRGWMEGRYAAIACGVLTVAMATRCITRAEAWTQALTLYQHELAIHPNDAVMNNNVGVELFRLGHILEARPYFEKATEINPVWTVAWNNLGVTEERAHHFDEALALYAKSASLSDYHLAYENYAKLLLATNQRDKCRQFLHDKALGLFPRNEILRSIASEVDH